jgi:hypothetical protein
MRGGAQEKLSDAEIAAKFHDNVRFGGWSDSQARALADAVTLLSAGGVVDFSAARN